MCFVIDMSEIEVGEMLADNCSETSVNDTSNERNYIGELQVSTLMYISNTKIYILSY